MRLKVIYITNIAPHYRSPIWLLMANHSFIDFHFAFDPTSKTGIKSMNFNSEKWTSFDSKLHNLKNFAVKGRIVFQKEVSKIFFSKKWDAVILLGDANIISNWLIALWCKMKKIPIVFWGHGLYGNESSWKRWWRVQFLKLGDINLVYGHHSKGLLMKNCFSPDTIQVIYNSLDYEVSLSLRESIIERNFYIKSEVFNKNYPVLFYIGRLTTQKRLDRFIDACLILKNKGHYFNLLFIGDGPVKNELESKCEVNDLPYHFTGGIYEEKEIAKYIANADLCVAPGEVGLTAIHSMSYGTPVCTHNSFINQGPEVEAIIDGKTGSFFDYDNNNLADTIENWFANSPSRERIRQNCFDVIDDNYNPHNQMKILEEAIHKVIN